jgi:hypothetical protein
VRFSGPDEPDLSGEWFDQETDFGARGGEGNVPTLFNHGSPVSKGAIFKRFADAVFPSAKSNTHRCWFVWDDQAFARGSAPVGSGAFNRTRSVEILLRFNIAISAAGLRRPHNPVADSRIVGHTYANGISTA